MRDGLLLLDQTVDTTGVAGRKRETPPGALVSPKDTSPRSVLGLM
jgi:hypothetical protein